MQGNDIANFNVIGQGVIFEGLLASPSERRVFQKYNKDWNKELRRWRAHDLPLKALIDTSDRLGIDTEIYTFLGEDAVEPIESWLVRKGISLPVYSYTDIKELAYDLRFKRSVRTLYVPEQEQAAIVGIRAQVVDSEKAWVI